MPPSTDTVCAVMNGLATSEHTTCATSSGLPSRPPEPAYRNPRSEPLARLLLVVRSSARERAAAFNEGRCYGVDRHAVRRERGCEGASKSNQGRFRSRVVRADEATGESGY